MQEFLPVITGLVSGLISAVITYFATRSKVRLDLTAEYDKKLRAERLDAYKLLWKELKPLARYSPENDLTYEIVKSVSGKMRDWYFDTGGIYLSKQSRKPYFELKETLQKIIDNKDLILQKAEPLKIDLTDLLEQGKDLRESLSDDIGTRRDPYI